MRSPISRLRLVLAATIVLSLASGCGSSSAAPDPSARLSSMELVDVELEPAFDPEVHSYRATPALCQTAVVITALAADPSHRVEVNGKRVAPTNPYVQVALNAVITEVVISILDAQSRSLGDYVILFDRALTLERTYLKAAYPGLEDQFGQAVAVSGETLVVAAPPEDGDGSPEDDDNAESAGAVYVFERVAGEWTQQAYLKAAPTQAHDGFGYSVAIDGDMIVVGAPWDDHESVTTGTVYNCGAAYVFVREGGVWMARARLEAEARDTNDFFGFRVAISGDTIVVSAFGEDSDGSSEADNSVEGAGAVYVYAKSGGGWVREAWLKASNPDPIDEFGGSVAIDGDTIVVGAQTEDSDGSSQADNSLDAAGAAYVFVRSGATWTQQRYLKADVPGQWDRFGIHVAIEGDTIVIGTPLEDSDGSTPYDTSAPDAGAVYVFERSFGAWAQVAWLKAWNAGAGDRFGKSVAISGDALLVGAPSEQSDGSSLSDNSLEDAGAAYLFVKQDGDWVPSSYLKASALDAGDEFGISVALHAGTALVGAYRESSDGSSQDDNSLLGSGAGYVFR